MEQQAERIHNIELNENNLNAILYGINTNDQIEQQARQFEAEEAASQPLQTLHLYVDGDFEHNRFFNHCYSGIATHRIMDANFIKFCDFCTDMNISHCSDVQLRNLGKSLYSDVYRIIIYPWDVVEAEWFDWIKNKTLPRNQNFNIYNLHINKISPYIQGETFDAFIAIAKTYVVKLKKETAIDFARRQYEFLFNKFVAECEEKKLLFACPRWDENQFVQYFYKINPPVEIVERRKEKVRKKIQKDNINVVKMLHDVVPDIVNNEEYKNLNSITASMQRLINSNNTLHSMAS